MTPFPKDIEVFSTVIRETIARVIYGIILQQLYSQTRSPDFFSFNIWSKTSKFHSIFSFTSFTFTFRYFISKQLKFQKILSSIHNNFKKSPILGNKTQAFHILSFWTFTLNTTDVFFKILNCHFLSTHINFNRCKFFMIKVTIRVFNYNIHTVSLVARTSIANPQGLGEDRSFAGGLYFWMLRCISAAWIFFLSDIYAFSSILYSHKSHDEGEEEGFVENGGMERGEGRLARVCLFLPFWLPYQHLYTRKKNSSSSLHVMS